MRDGFVGSMKGAALSVNPNLRFVDVSHDVGPGRILEGALILASVFRVFPEGTIFVAVVDPGVGTDRRILAARAAGRVVVAPDNGLITPALDADPGAEVRAVVETRYFRSPAHPTFHGRDVFAPVAAHVSLGVPLESLGPQVRDPVRVEPPRPQREGASLVGEVIHVDRFGNLVTNLTEEDLGRLGSPPFVFEISGREVSGVSTTYEGSVAPLIVVVGSWGTLEVALRGGDAARGVGAGLGTAVRATAGEARA